jgi:hypothetical protein
MSTELRRGTIRISSNYARLLFGLALGIAYVPIFIMGVGGEAFGLIGLLGSSMGIAEMCGAIARASLKRELGSAYHSGSPHDFPTAYNSALVISSALCVLTVALFAVIYAVLPLFRIPDELMGAARSVVIAKGCYSALTVLLAPPFNMFQITERMILYNTWIVLDRATDFLAAFLLFVVLGVRDPSVGLVWYAWLSAGTGILVLLFAVGLIMGMDRRLIPALRGISRRQIRAMLPTTGWNAIVVTAMNLHIRVDQFIMNIAFGLMGNAMFHIAVRLTSYVRIAAFGNTDGMDVVSARLMTTGRGIGVTELAGYSTRLHAAIAVPSALLVLILAEPLINAWIGRISRAAEDPTLISGAVVIAKILILGMTIRGIADGWQSILYGAGHVRRYGPAVLIGGIFNPIIAVALIMLLPSSVAYQGPAWAYSVVMLLVHFAWLPKIAASSLEVRVRDIMLPIVRPAVAALLASVILWLPALLGREDSLLLLGATVLGFAATHALLCWFFVLTVPERGRLTGAMFRRLGVVIPTRGGA